MDSPMMSLSFLRLSRMSVSIWAFVVSSAMPWLCIYREKCVREATYALTDLLCLCELLDGRIHACLQDLDLGILLLANPVHLAADVLQLGHQVVDLELLGLRKSQRPLKGRI